MLANFSYNIVMDLTFFLIKKHFSVISGGIDRDGAILFINDIKMMLCNITTLLHNANLHQIM